MACTVLRGDRRRNAAVLPDTGYNAALLAQRLGAGNVVTIEVDSELAHTARVTQEHTATGSIIDKASFMTLRQQRFTQPKLTLTADDDAHATTRSPTSTRHGRLKSRLRPMRGLKQLRFTHTDDHSCGGDHVIPGDKGSVGIMAGRTSPHVQAQARSDRLDSRRRTHEFVNCCLACVRVGAVGSCQSRTPRRCGSGGASSGECARTACPLRSRVARMGLVNGSVRGVP